MGTVGYMSPEQVRGNPADHRADIFAFGAILYEMLTGKRAFQKPTAAETLTAILNEEPPLLSQLGPLAPPAMQRVVHRCLEKSPEQRFQSASDLAFALDALSESSSIAVAPASPEGERRSKLIAAVVGFAVLALLAGMAAVSLSRAEISRRRDQRVRPTDQLRRCSRGSGAIPGRPHVGVHPRRFHVRWTRRGLR